MSATIRRGAPARRPSVRRKPTKRPLIARMIERLPIGHDHLRRGVTMFCLLAGAAAIIVAARLAGVPAMISGAAADVAGRAGLRVEQIEVTGLHRMDFMTVNAVALDQKSLAMPAVDLERVRERLLAYGWVKDAHVSRRLPDTLLIHIDERIPAAVWQDQGRLALVDATGVVLDSVDPNHMPDLPLVIGPGANAQEAAYRALLLAAPALAPKVRAATWVGNRRWDLTFDTGETLALPEGDKDAAAALTKFASMNAARALLGKGWLRFDLRMPDKLIARRPGAAAHEVSDPGDAAQTQPVTHDGQDA